MKIDRRHKIKMDTLPAEILCLIAECLIDECASAPAFHALHALLLTARRWSALIDRDYVAARAATVVVNRPFSGMYAEATRLPNGVLHGYSRTIHYDENGVEALFYIYYWRGQLRREEKWNYEPLTSTYTRHTFDTEDRLHGWQILCISESDHARYELYEHGVLIYAVKLASEPFGGLVDADWTAAWDRCRAV